MKNNFLHLTIFMSIASLISCDQRPAQIENEVSISPPADDSWSYAYEHRTYPPSDRSNSSLEIQRLVDNGWQLFSCGRQQFVIRRRLEVASRIRPTNPGVLFSYIQIRKSDKRTLQTFGSRLREASLRVSAEPGQVSRDEVLWYSSIPEGYLSNAKPGVSGIADAVDDNEESYCRVSSLDLQNATTDCLFRRGEFLAAIDVPASQGSVILKNYRNKLESALGVADQITSSVCR